MSLRTNGPIGNDFPAFRFPFDPPVSCRQPPPIPCAHDVVVLAGNPLDDIGLVAGEGERVAYVLQRGKIVKARASALR